MNEGNKKTRGDPWHDSKRYAFLLLLFLEIIYCTYAG